MPPSCSEPRVCACKKGLYGPESPFRVWVLAIAVATRVICAAMAVELAKKAYGSKKHGGGLCYGAGVWDWRPGAAKAFIVLPVSV